MSNLKNAKCVMMVGVATLAFAIPAVAQSSGQLDDAMRRAKNSTAASAASQERVENLDDQADAAAREYSALLQQVDNLELFVARQDLYLESQLSEMRSLERQLSTIESTKQNMVPMMLKMAYKLEDEIRADYPFNLDERLHELEVALMTLSDPAKSPDDQYDQLLKVYRNEVVRGRDLAAYEGPHPDDANQTVDFVNYGRVAFLFMSKDEKEIQRYDLATETWQPVEENLVLEMRNAIRMALGETGDSLALVPVKVTN
ncbi:MAG: DUF3450 domain-containing protein [Hellea sp.]|nr:DUF3450 domain-containing protein [Hellea sp.]